MFYSFYFEKSFYSEKTISQMKNFCSSIIITAAAAVVLSSSPASGQTSVVLSGDTSRPNTSTFIPGENISLNFKVSGLTSANSNLKLQITISDEHNKQLSYQEIPISGDSSGNWNTTI